jgi:hypothetical protein
LNCDKVFPKFKSKPISKLKPVKSLSLHELMLSFYLWLRPWAMGRCLHDENVDVEGFSISFLPLVEKSSYRHFPVSTLPFVILQRIGQGHVLYNSAWTRRQVTKKLKTCQKIA